MMSGASELGEGAISFERVYNASMEDVWALWTTKDGLEEWYARRACAWKCRPSSCGSAVRSNT